MLWWNFIDNPDMKDTALAMGGVPYMIKNCIQDDSNWSRTQCNNSCCQNEGSMYTDSTGWILS